MKPNHGFWPDEEPLQWFRSHEGKKKCIAYIKTVKRKKTNLERIVVNNLFSLYAKF